jgi:ribonuclease BN (tRNA processing enzyme)
MSIPPTFDPSVPHVVTLGTAGGPRWWQGPAAGRRSGIATAVVVEGKVYLVDCGESVGTKLLLAGLDIADVRSIFITHLHSDHTIDLPNLVVWGTLALAAQRERQAPIQLVGPGDRGMLPPVSAHVKGIAPTPVGGSAPTPGVRGTLERIVDAYATDLNDRIFDTLRPSPLEWFQPREIVIPDGLDYHPNDNPSPDMAPIEVYRDDLVTVTAVLVQHQPMAPAFAFRFETAQGSVTISGDTAPCDNLVRLARGTDLLLHEAIDLTGIADRYQGEDPAAVEAGMEHHRKAHTTPEQAGTVAASAGARALALHHLVPSTASPDVWNGARKTFDGQFLVPFDLDTIPFGDPRIESSQPGELATATSSL